jgi:LacI family gluconate utilization system Gnt-I transcriptional repressor
VLGFGNISNGQFAYPALSTVSVNAQEMGHQVAEALLRRLEGGSREAQVDTSFEILEREST